MENSENSVELRSQRIKILMLAGIFLVPLAIAVYLVGTNWRPPATSNYGDLVVPAVPLQSVKLITIDGKQLSLESFRHNWLLLTFAKSDCDKACEQNIYKMRQTHVGQGKYQMRVKRMLVLTGKQSAGIRERFKDYPQMAIVNAPSGAINKLGHQIKTHHGDALQGLNRIYIIDPLGNLMMSYDANAKASGIRKDISRLLRVSRIG